MKRALKKRVKAVLKNTPNSESAPVEQLNVVNPKANRRAHTKAAMIGLAISMGATSLLMTRQSDQAQAAAPVGSQKAASAAPVAPENDVKFASTKLENKASSLASLPENSVIVEPTAISQVPGLEAKLQVSASAANYQTSLYLHPQALQGQTVKFQELQKLSNADVGSQAALQPQTEGKVASSTINAQLKAQQEFALNRLQEKSNRLKKSLAELGSEESKGLSKVAIGLAQPTTTVETAPQVNANSGVTQQLPTVADVNRNNLISSLKQAKLDSAPLATSAPTTLKVAALPEPVSYEVKPGDTLAAIASRYGISVAELVRANNLTNPNQLQISQKLIIPANGVDRSTANQSQLATNPITQKLVTTPANTASESVNLPVSSQLSVVANGSNITVPTPATANDLMSVNPSLANAYGVGGDTPVRKAYPGIQFPKKPEKIARTKSNERLRSLQAEIERLKQKYRAQQGGVTVAESPENDAAVSLPVSRNNFAVSSPVSPRNAVQIPVPSPVGNYSAQPIRPLYRATRPTNEPINPEFLPNQSFNQLPNASGARSIAPRGNSDSLGNMRGRTVSPQLPPLAAVDQYLPKPLDEATPPPSSSSVAYAWPAKGVLTSGFGMRWGRPHKGIDIANSVGTPIYASADGVIEKAGWNNGGYGNVVDIRHTDGSLTRYGHNSKILMQAGQPVRQGQMIALMGSTGFSTGPHSHFEIHPSGKGAVNPIALLANRI